MRGLRALVLIGLALAARSPLRALESDLTVWQRAVRVHPTAAIAWLNLGQARAMRGESVSARANYQLALRYATDPRVRLVASLNLVVDRASRGQWSQAQRDLTDIQRHWPPIVAPSLEASARQIDQWIGRQSSCAEPC